MTNLDPGTVVTVTITRRDYAGEWTDTTTGPIAYVNGDHIHVNGRWYWTSAPSIRVVADEPISSTSEPATNPDTDDCPVCACDPCECGTPCEHGIGPYDDCAECFDAHTTWITQTGTYTPRNAAYDRPAGPLVFTIDNGQPHGRRNELPLFFQLFGKKGDQF